VDALLVSGEASLLTAVTHLLSESAVGFVRCGLDVQAGWRMYGAADAASGSHVTRITERLRGDGLRPGPVGVGSVGGVLASVGAERAAAATGADSAAAPAAAAAAPSPGPEVLALLGLSAEQSAAFEANAAVMAASLGAAVAGADPGAAATVDVDPRWQAGVRADAAPAPRRDAASAALASALHDPSLPGGAKARSVLGGLLFGVGAFNIIGSVLPPSIARLIQFFGFPADR